MAGALPPGAWWEPKPHNETGAVPKVGAPYAACLPRLHLLVTLQPANPQQGLWWVSKHLPPGTAVLAIVDNNKFQ